MKTVQSAMWKWCGGLSLVFGLTILPAAQATNPIWINPSVCGTPISSHYLGDSLGSPWYVNFEIGQSSWDYAQVGYGTAADGTGYNWGNAPWYEDGEGSNKRVRRDIGGLQFTATGSWYVICQAREGSGDTYTSASACGWTDSTTYPPASMAYFTVNALNNPSTQDAAVASESQINLSWVKNPQNHNVMVVRKLSTDSWTEPTQGTAYSAGNSIGSGTVVYNGSNNSFNDTDLAADTTYDYKFYSENNSYYSAGVTASDTTYPATLETVLSLTSVNVRQNGDGRFFVRLNKPPAGTLTVATARLSGDTTLSVKGGASLVFNSLNWNVWRAVTLTATAGGTATFRVSASGVDSQDVTATVLDQNLGDNHALASGGATITGFAATRMGLAIDGTHTERANYGTVCYLNTEPDGTMTLDLQDVIALSNVRILNWDFSYRTQQYAIEFSLDGTTWSPLVDASTGEHVGWEDWAVSETARYLRFTGLGNSADMPVLVAEWEVYGTVVPQPTIEVSQSAINVRESGEGRFWVRLGSAPLANFTVVAAWDSGDAGITVQSGATMVFRPTDWNVWKPVVLAAAADEDDDDETAQIQMYATGVPAGVFVTATALDDDIGTNLALASGGATISGVSALRAAMAIDGVHSDRTNYACTVFLNVDPDGTMTLDLQSAQELGRIRVQNWDWIYRTQGYVIESSTDGETWSSLVDASEGAHIGWEDWEVSATARYLRFTGLYNSANKPVIVAELEVYGPPPAGRRSLAPALGGSVAAESEPISVLTSDGPEDETGWNAVDGDDATAWVGQKVGGGYVVVEYAPALTLSGLEVDVTEASLADIEVLTSLDAIDWQPLPEDLEANPVALNFLWLLFPDDGSGAGPEVIEIRPNP